MATFKLYKEGKDYHQISIKKIRDGLTKIAPLECFEFTAHAPGEHWVSIASPELTSICPFSDYPDFGAVTIEYVPNKRCLELKSFKLYINAFREVKIFHESLTELIFADFLEAVKPLKARISIDMNVRGNVKTVCKKYYKCSPQ
ncbi:preQ(1) synthase [Candidatus Peregrinibacteria bacterium CG11_big_fil_rev_8_21_14_0_20_46_8]|nr:MAG: preQ(1) synthase [Candidatus Peregrinibacteria bacterium CG11_big_fil_rev_8_21_14_0_20_46_8]